MRSVPLRLLGPLLAGALLSGCATSGLFETVHLTNVQLSNGNFRVVARNVSGEASASYLVGFSGSVGAQTSTFALVRVAGEGLLYKAALEDLWRNFELKHGAVEGRRLALVNVRQDADALNVLFLYTRPKVSIRADVVEFVP